jgi:hypothetical protein
MVLQDCKKTVDEGYFIVTHEPPPTGSLDERVASLHDLVRKLLDGDRLPHDVEPPFPADRVHLVGHSTGAVDARLLANDHYVWSGGPRKDEREDVRKAVERIVTISAPFYGTPIATHIALDANLALVAVQTLTMLGALQNGTIDVATIRALLLDAPLLEFRQIVEAATTRARSGPFALPAVLANQKAVSDSKLVADQLGRFFQKLEDDRQLLGQLTLSHLGRGGDLQEQLKGGDRARIESYVTVSPAPRLRDVVEGHPLQRMVYAILHEATARDEMPGDIQPGAERYFGDPRAEDECNDLLARPRACDGVVPARSQLLDGGILAGRVFADHQDVVGSFKGGGGADVMKSGANFGQGAFTELWTDIANRLVPL